MSAAHTTDYWAGRFEPAREHNAGGGLAMYRKCTRCGSHAMEGSLSAHARWCDKQHKDLTLAAFDALQSDARRPLVDQRNAVRQAAKGAL